MSDELPNGWAAASLTENPPIAKSGFGVSYGRDGVVRRSKEGVLPILRANNL